MYQNLLFYYENESSVRASGVVLLEGCYCERMITAASSKGKDTDKQVSTAGARYDLHVLYGGIMTYML